LAEHFEMQKGIARGIVESKRAPLCGCISDLLDDVFINKQKE
jgi:hypothetical protein